MTDSATSRQFYSSESKGDSRPLNMSYEEGLKGILYYMFLYSNLHFCSYSSIINITKN
jgi:hypothetical protein